MAGDTPPAKRSNDCTEDSPAKRPRYDCSKIIKILVGNDRTTFFVHKDAICAKSIFVRAHFEQRSVDAPENGMLLGEIRPEGFELYMDWTYDNTLETATASDTPMTRLIRLYLVGEKLEDDELRRRSVERLSLPIRNCFLCKSWFYIDERHPRSSRTSKDTMIKKMSEVWDNVGSVWPETNPESLLGKRVVDATIAKASEADFGGRLGSFPQDFKDEVLMKLILQPSKTDENDAFCKKTSDYY